jgi:hypothetical protein
VVHYSYSLLVMLITLASAAPTQASSSINTTYYFIKQAMYNDEASDRLRMTFVYRENDTIYLEDCGNLADLLHTHEGKRANKIDLELEEVAFDVLDLKSNLLGTKYPLELWEPILKEYETNALQKLNSGAKFPDEIDRKKLANVLNDYRAKHPNLNLNAVSPGSPGCGAGDVSVQIITHPKAFRIQYIQKLSFDLCLFKKLDVYDDCDYWEDYGTNSFDYMPGTGGVQMAGHYKVLITWPDKTRSPLLDFVVDHLPKRGKDDFDRVFEFNK